MSTIEKNISAVKVKGEKRGDREEKWYFLSLAMICYFTFCVTVYFKLHRSNNITVLILQVKGSRIKGVKYFTQGQTVNTANSPVYKPSFGNYKTHSVSNILVSNCSVCG